MYVLVKRVIGDIRSINSKHISNRQDTTANRVIIVPGFTQPLKIYLDSYKDGRVTYTISNYDIVEELVIDMSSLTVDPYCLIPIKVVIKKHIGKELVDSVFQEVCDNMNKFVSLDRIYGWYGKHTIDYSITWVHGILHIGASMPITRYATLNGIPMRT